MGFAASGVRRGGRAGVTTLQAAVTRGCCLCTIYISRVANLPQNVLVQQWAGSWQRNEIFASRKGSEFGSSEVGLGLFAKIPCLAKMLVLDFVSVHFTKHHKKCLWIITDLHLLFYITYIYIKRSWIHLYIDNFAFETIVAWICTTLL